MRVGIIEWILQLHNSEFLRAMIENGGIPVVTFIVFAETGLLAGFFLPGDSLLITAGVLTSSQAIGGHPLFSLYTLLVATVTAAVAGDQLGYYLGRTGGRYAENHGKPRTKKFLAEAKEFFAAYGGRALIYARFIPIMRTFMPFAAGLSHMRYRRFVALSLGGGIGWVISMVLIGNVLGKSKYADQLHKILIIVILVSVLPVVIGAGKKVISHRRRTRT